MLRITEKSPEYQSVFVVKTRNMIGDADGYLESSLTFPNEDATLVEYLISELEKSIDNREYEIDPDNYSDEDTYYSVEGAYFELRPREPYHYIMTSLEKFSVYWYDDDGIRWKIEKV